MRREHRLPERRLLTVGHSYVVAENRRLAHEMAVQGRGRWKVTVVAPASFRGDLRQVECEPIAGEACELRCVPLRFDRSPHFMWYGGLREAMAGAWDIVHCWEEPYVFAGAQIARASSAASALVVATFQNISKTYPWPLSTFECRTMARANGWIAFGESIERTLKTRAGYGGRATVIPPGVDVSRFRPDSSGKADMLGRLGWPRTARVVGFTGRFVAQKGVLTLCDALEGAHSDWRALFVGGGPLEGNLRQFASRFSGRVHVETGVSHSEMPRWLNAMSVLCAPSQTTATWREQFGRMSIEAMASGVPVIASDSGEIPHVVGDAGIIVPERDTNAWTDAIDRLLLDDVLRRDLAARGLERATRCFAWPVVARRHLEFFDRVLEGLP
jgi:glycosyltransferase involved in cell wall biosynthesis